jgi:hypothetical protein
MRKPLDAQVPEELNRSFDAPSGLVVNKAKPLSKPSLVSNSRDWSDEGNLSEHSGND